MVSRALYHQTITFTGEMVSISDGQYVSKSVSEMHFPGSRDLENQISKSPSLGTHHRRTSRNSELANSKETAVDKSA